MKARLMKILPVLLLSFMLAMAVGAEQVKPAPEIIAEKLQANYEKLTTFSADFTQTTQIKLNRRERQGSGTLVLLKPKYLRWDYYTPERQIMISDGSDITMYFEKSRQMIVSGAAEYLQSDVTYSFFTGSGNILHDFIVNEGADEENAAGSLVIELVPKESHPHLERLYVWTSRDTFLIDRLQIIDLFGTVTDLYFNNIAVDQNAGGEINDSLFHFTPPPDTEIIKQ